MLLFELEGAPHPKVLRAFTSISGQPVSNPQLMDCSMFHWNTFKYFSNEALQQLVKASGMVLLDPGIHRFATKNSIEHSEML